MTLVSLAATRIPETIRAIESSRERVSFARSLLLTPSRRPSGLSKEIDWFDTGPLRLRGAGIDDYSYFMIFRLHEYIDSPHCLVVQHDGYVLNPRSWRPEFLDYDYIGAPWPLIHNAYVDPFGCRQRVGNGGFSLRSRRLLTVPERHPLPWPGTRFRPAGPMTAGDLHEDGYICVHHRRTYEKDGCLFAPVEIAAHFSQELPTAEGKGIDPFGFHRHLPGLRNKFKHRLQTTIRG